MTTTVDQAAPKTTTAVAAPDICLRYESEDGAIKGRSYFHTVTRNNHVLALALDRRAKYPVQVPGGTQQYAVQIEGQDRIYFVTNPDIDFSLDNYDVFVLLIMDESQLPQ